MSDHSPAEESLRTVSVVAAGSDSTNPWGPVRMLLQTHAGGNGRVIGIQDSTVIDRAIGSPGMLKQLDVHGFIVKEAEGRPSAEVMTVVAKLRQQIEVAPYISAAVIIPYTNEYYPSHVLSSGTPSGYKLAEMYPNAIHILDLEKRGVERPRGPWRVVVEATQVDNDGSVSMVVDDPEEEMRSLHPGDAILFVQPGDAVPFGVGRLHHLYPTDNGGIVLVLDRYHFRLPKTSH